MTAAVPQSSSSWGCHLISTDGCGFPAPGAEEFAFDPLFTIGPFGITKPVILLFLAAFLVLAFFLYAFRNPKIVPRGVQNVAELAYTFIRDGISRDVIGKQGDKMVPFLFTFFFLIWVLNLFEVIPGIQFPPASMFAIPVAFALIVYFTWVPLGMIRQGPGKFIKGMVVPSGIPVPMYFLLTPIEVLSNFIVRPFTHAVRLFANMFAGHLLLTTFSVAAWYLFSASVIGVIGSAASFLMLVVLTAFELLIGALQAYIFTLLTAVYLADAYSEGH